MYHLYTITFLVSSPREVERGKFNSTLHRAKIFRFKFKYMWILIT